VQIDGPAVDAPVTFTAVVGMKRTLTADAAQILSGVTYAFQKWTKGRKTNLDFTVPAKNQTIEAFYVATPTPTGG
jgi:hypothetical protein